VKSLKQQVPFHTGSEIRKIHEIREESEEICSKLQTTRNFRHVLTSKRVCAITTKFDKTVAFSSEHHSNISQDSMTQVKLIL
jgi:hypothetical protein